MDPMKVKVHFFTFSYSGNGGTASGHPDVMKWLMATILKCKDDPRISHIAHTDLADTPITMTRNRAAVLARKSESDIMVMIDSDMAPDYLVGSDSGARPFWDTSFEFAYNRLLQGKQSCIMAPYCGMSPEQLVFVFRWRSKASGKPADHLAFELDMYKREEAIELGGIQPCAAGPTGLTMLTVPMLDWTEPNTKLSKEEALAQFKDGKLSMDDVLKVIEQRPWFYYDFDPLGAYKHSTEDVTFTRDLSFFGLHIHDYESVFCNWDSWAGHWKPERVGRPVLLHNQDVGRKFADAVKRLPPNKKRVQVDFTGGADYGDVPYEENGHVELAETLDVARKIENTHSQVHPRNGRGFPWVPHEGPSVIQHVLDSLRGTSMEPCERRRLNEIASSVARFDMLTAIEVGCWIGDGTKTILDGMGKAAQIFCVDHFAGSPDDPTQNIASLAGGADVIYAVFRENTKDYESQINCIRQKSPGAASQFKDGEAGIILIDADHSYEACLADLRAWWPKLAPEGAFVVHDYKWAEFPGVTQAVDKFLVELGYEGPTYTEDKLFWIYKGAALCNGKTTGPELSLSAT